MGIVARVVEDLRTARAHVPAARGYLEMVLGYPGLHAVWLHRVSHALWRRRLRLAARLLAQAGRALTGWETTRARASGGGSSSTTAWASS